jgi:ubiquinone/menaquinone biosynthesis C-methylase UbiE
LKPERETIWRLLSGMPELEAVTEAQIRAWPEHQHYLATRFGADDSSTLQRVNEIAALALKIMGGELDRFCGDYRWMCDNFNEEQYYFAKSGRYRLATFAEAFERVYNNAEYMSRYVRGILLSQIFWRNHAQATDYFRTKFLPRNIDGYHHLEVGPGHGLFLYMAARDSRAGSVMGWDVSKSSLAATRRCLDILGVGDRVRLVERDVLDRPAADDGPFESILISEVLEHLERPDVALATLKQVLSEKGRILVNVPINSPAPDHIYLWKSFNEVAETVRSVGLRVTEAEYYPVTGYTLDEALKRRLSISCVVTCGHAD